MAATDKDTIYIDIDDEITGIIDKLHASSGKVVALVLPKRASVFQSVVNMKLLKRAADASKKNLVLITAEAGLLPLAGMAGIHVAKTLNSKPEIPTAPQLADDVEETVEEDGQIPEVNAETAGDEPVGKLAGATAVGSKPLSDDGVETLTLDDEDLPPEAEAAAAAGAKTFEPSAEDKKKAKKTKKKLSVPNFERFRLFLILFVLLIIAAIIAFFLLNKALDKATINIKTDATNVNANLNLNLSTATTSLDPSTNTVPAKLVQQQKTSSAQAVTTGQKNEGNEASGTVNMTAQVCNTIPDQAPADVPAGTGLSSNGLTYITQQDTSFSSNPGPPKNHCENFNATSSTPVTAQSPGSSYNGANTFTVAGRSDVSASVNTAISGGTDNIVQVVNQNDINSAKAKIATNTDSTMKQTLENQLQQAGYFPIVSTYSSGTPSVTSSENVGQAANNVTVTETITYTMFGAHQSDLNTLIDNSVNTQIDTAKQSILNNGLSSAVFGVNNATATTAQLTLQTTAVAGPQLNVSQIKQQSAGKKSGDIQSALQSNPDVTSVSVKFSPFWVSSVPKNTSKITVNIAKPTTTKTSKPNVSNP
jgi:hypothetical protein